MNVRDDIELKILTTKNKREAVILIVATINKN